MKNTCLKLISFGLILFSLSCGAADSEINKTTDLDPPISPEPTATAADKPASATFVDVPALADKPAAAFDETFGPPQKITEITDNPAMMPGEYRLYNVAGHPKGLSVRFYKDRAKRFNLLLGEPLASAREALGDVFNIDVKKMPPDTSEPLSEKWAGELSGIRFITAYAKKEKTSGDFTMVHAEIAD